MKCSCTFDDEFDEWKLAVIKMLFNEDVIPIGFTKEKDDGSGLRNGSRGRVAGR